MSKDYKMQDSKPRGSGSSLLIGILIGLVLGLGIALGIAWYINKMPNPFATRIPPMKTEPAPAPAKSEEKKAAAPEGKPRFDFYKILPGTDETPTAKQGREPQKKKAAARETFFLQAGAFQNAPDADNLKARLALLGVEATIQTTTLPDKGVWHRVRVGPYTNVEELGRTRETLKQNGVETTLIKVRE
jgi:cell division protein FtsN